MEDQIRQLRDKLSQDASVEELKASMAALSKTSQEIAQKAYQETAQDGTTSSGASAEDSPADGADGDYIDAEYDEKDS
jgi:hypothetical protein